MPDVLWFGIEHPPPLGTGHAEMQDSDGGSGFSTDVSDQAWERAAPLWGWRLVHTKKKNTRFGAKCTNVPPSPG